MTINRTARNNRIRMAGKLNFKRSPEKLPLATGIDPDAATVLGYPCPSGSRGMLRHILGDQFRLLHNKACLLIKQLCQQNCTCSLFVGHDVANFTVQFGNRIVHFLYILYLDLTVTPASAFAGTPWNRFAFTIG